MPDSVDLGVFIRAPVRFPLADAIFVGNEDETYWAYIAVGSKYSARSGSALLWSPLTTRLQALMFGSRSRQS